jgi:DNA polymerase I-like protein with 3'-5' exonuclease and polymerase domains
MIIFDIETNGLLDDLDKVHCLVLKDTSTDKVETYTNNIQDGLKRLEQADCIIGHNIIKFDLPALKKVYDFNYKGKLRDTLVLTRLIWSDIKERDFQTKDFPTKLIGRHSLQAWGVRLGNTKGDYTGSWEQFNDEMLSYCIQDVHVTDSLWKKICEKNYSEESIELEHRLAKIIYQQECNGFKFNTTKAQRLYSELAAKRESLKEELKYSFPDWEVRTPFIPKVNNKKLGYRKGIPTEKVQVIEFNPSSRDHVANRLINLRGWKPKQYTNDGKPKVDEDVLKSLPYPESKVLVEYYTIEKRIGQLAEGRQAWLKLVKNNRIYGSVNTNGAVTGRATHSHPNVGQVPATTVPYGKECRELFTVEDDNVLVGIDVSGLELRCLAHFMSRYDNGTYIKEVLDGDIHTANQKAAGLDTRAQAKTFIYALVYGCGAAKMGEILGKDVKAGKKIISDFMKRTPALKRLIEDVQQKATKGYIKGLDGRQLKIRSAHKALNTLLQSSGALICKQWIIDVHELIHQHNLDCKQVAWVHDEIQIETRKEHADELGKLAKQAIRNSEKKFSFRCELDCEYRVGKDWSQTH